ncbi:hypothetical protein BHYA_0115g00330 [Botrytis hyacinthi]|uniref:Uncharacterized protein n=1 Tax=Botrytis hyacinthi TaxID=278943 RepID=A0A4Z1GMV7_9HELO|nr:hypothetical protein BHYA_0115g00330 [Botrytis hyacinthi]
MVQNLNTESAVARKFQQEKMSRSKWYLATEATNDIRNSVHATSSFHCSFSLCVTIEIVQPPVTLVSAQAGNLRNFFFKEEKALVYGASKFADS